MNSALLHSQDGKDSPPRRVQQELPDTMWSAIFDMTSAVDALIFWGVYKELMRIASDDALWLGLFKQLIASHPAMREWPERHDDEPHFK